MGLEVSGIGVIAIVCGGCGARLYWYVIGDGPEGNRRKFGGPPVPGKALRGFDGECPLCGRRIPGKPRRIEVLTRREFEDRFVVTDYQVLERMTLVEEQLVTAAEASLASVSAAESEAEGV